MGIKRERVQKDLAKAESYGYLTSSRRKMPGGAEGAKVFTFNLEIVAQGKACPLQGSMNELVAPENGGMAYLQNWGQGVPPNVGAHNKTIEDTKEETLKALSIAQSNNEQDGDTDPSMHAKGMANGHDGFHRPTVSAKGQKPRPKQLTDRVSLYTLDLRRSVSGRLSSEWCQLDPGMQLFERLGRDGEKVFEKAIDAEVKARGRGVRYLAGAVERATAKTVTKAAILGGRYARRASGST